MFKFSSVNNLTAKNSARMLGLNMAAKAKSAEKLSSGYKINRAADDAAGLAISEKLRKKIRGLNQGTQNAQDGVSWVQVADGALEEAQDMVHRMTELTVKSLNGTNSVSDRAALEAEFEQLKVELNRISTTTKFNEKNVFSEHKQYWHECVGNVKWDIADKHVIRAGENELTFLYRETEQSSVSTMTVYVKPGEYTTMELLDEIDSELSGSMGESIRLYLQHNQNGYIDASLEGGAALDAVSGSLSYLLYEMGKGGTIGSLIGTTIFPTENSTLRIEQDKNDSMTFSIEYFDGSPTLEKTVTLKPGYHTRAELIKMLNDQLAGTSVEATAYGTGIKLGSSAAMVTGFKGNMFKIDGGLYTSVFYDNVHHGSIEKHEAIFKGGYVLSTNSYDPEHNRINIVAGQNDTLTLQPNDCSSPVSMTFAPGSYTMSQISSMINSFFQQEQLDLTASVITSQQIDTGMPPSTSSYIPSSARYTYFQGLEIKSNIKGLDSHINIDKNCSAYNTLFVDRKFNQYGTKASVQNESKADSAAYFTGSKQLTAPITLNSTNNSFKINYRQTGTSSASTVEIKLAATTYNTLDDLIAEINNKIAGSACSGIVTACSNGIKIQLEEVTGSDLMGVTASAVSGNTGYNTLFVGTTTTTATITGNGSIILNGTINDVNSNGMDIIVDGKTHHVTFPSSNPTQEEIKNAINNTIKASSTTVVNTFNNVSDTNSGRHFTVSGKGSSTVTQWGQNIIARGETKGSEGVAGDYHHTPAVLELGPSLKSTMVIGSGNDSLNLSLNILENGTGGARKEIKLTHGTYTPAQLVAELQKKIDAAFGTGMGGAIVSLSGQKITLTSRLPLGEAGDHTSIHCSTVDSSFLSYLNTRDSAAVCTSTQNLISSIKIDDKHNKFSFQYTENGKTQSVELTLQNGNYSPSSIINQINTQLGKTSTGIRASYTSGKLSLTSQAGGSNVSISYDTKAAGNAMDALFGPLEAAQLVVPLDTKESITIAPGKQNFKITVNGTLHTVQLDTGTYDRSAFLAMLNGKLSAVGVVADFDGSRLRFTTTTTTSSGASLKMSYDSGTNSSMEAIYGSSTVIIPGVKAEWVNDNLKLTAVDTNGNPMPDKKVSISSNTGGGLAKPTVTTVSPTSHAGYHSRNYSKVDGANLNGPVTIDQFNKSLQFTFTEPGKNHSISVTLDEKTYTYEQLKNELQGKIDAQTGPGKIQVTVNANGVELAAPNYGNQYQFSNLDGGFYQYVMNARTKHNDAQNVGEQVGYQDVVRAYVVGRQDVKTNPVDIRKGISDELIFEMTFGGNTHKIQITLDPGRYNSDALKNHLQKKFDEKMLEMGLPAGLIQVGVGGISSGVAGGNDERALNFSLSGKVPAPEEGEFIIEGVSGNAAFEIFYQTQGKMIPAYIIGTRDVSKGVTVKPDETEMTFNVDGKIYSIDLEPGKYNGDELIDEFNNKLEEIDAPVVASLDPDTGRVKISHKLVDQHTISWVSGSARDEVFFDEDGDLEDPELRIQLSDENPDYIELPRSEFSTTLLGMGSLCISGIKYATKALDRLSNAQEKISSLRSTFGSIQNRLEYAINNNKNKEENLQSAESLIRDTDINTELVRQSMLNIMQQAGTSILTQANQSINMILNLLA